jgi:hypothetical protein
MRELTLNETIINCKNLLFGSALPRGRYCLDTPIRPSCVSVYSSLGHANNGLETGIAGLVAGRCGQRDGNRPNFRPRQCIDANVNPATFERFISTKRKMKTGNIFRGNN